MDEYISKTKFEELMRKKARNNFDLYYADKSKHYHDNAIGYQTAADEAHDFPSSDVQPVVHCKDCKYAQNPNDTMVYCTYFECGTMSQNDFCSQGERSC